MFSLKVMPDTISQVMPYMVHWHLKVEVSWQFSDCFFDILQIVLSDTQRPWSLWKVTSPCHVLWEEVKDLSQQIMTKYGKYAISINQTSKSSWDILMTSNGALDRSQSSAPYTSNLRKGFSLFAGKWPEKIFYVHRQSLSSLRACLFTKTLLRRSVTMLRHSVVQCHRVK